MKTALKVQCSASHPVSIVSATRRTRRTRIWGGREVVRMKHNGPLTRRGASYLWQITARTTESISYIVSLQIHHCKQRIVVEYAVACFRLKRGFRLSY